MTTSNDGTGAASAAPSLVISENATLAEVDRAEQVARDLIDDVQDPAVAEELLRKVTSAAEVARLMKVGADREQRWRGLRLRAERRYGELLGPAHTGGQREGHVSATNVDGGQRFAQHQARKVAAVPESDFEAYLADSPKPTRTGLLRKTATGARRRKRGNEVPPAEATERLRQRAREVRSLPSDQRPRWTERDVDIVEAVLANPVKPRAKYSGKRLRELAAKRRNGHELAKLQYRIVELVGILESVDVADYNLSDADDVSQFHDDLFALYAWMDRAISLASARLDDERLEQKIRKLRAPDGRTDAERRTAAMLADRLERRRRESQLT